MARDPNRRPNCQPLPEKYTCALRAEDNDSCHPCHGMDDGGDGDEEGGDSTDCTTAAAEEEGAVTSSDVDSQQG